MRGKLWVSRAKTEGSSPAASSRASAPLRPRNANIVKISRPPSARCAGAPAITRSSTSQPSTPPLSAAASGSSRSRPGGVGIWGGLVQIRSKRRPATGASPSPSLTSTVSATPLSAAFSRAQATAAGTMSVAMTRQPARAASTAASPIPVPISSTRSPGRKVRWRQKSSEPALGGWTPSATLKRQPPEVQPQRFLELGAGTRRRLRVLELLELELQRHALLLEAVQLGREAAALVGFGEDDLRAREALVVLGDLLDGLGEEALDRLLIGGRHRRERGGQADLGHDISRLTWRRKSSGCRHAPWRHWLGWRS